MKQRDSWESLDSSLSENWCSGSAARVGHQPKASVIKDPGDENQKNESSLSWKLHFIALIKKKKKKRECVAKNYVRTTLMFKLSISFGLSYKPVKSEDWITHRWVRKGVAEQDET